MIVTCIIASVAIVTFADYFNSQTVGQEIAKEEMNVVE
jgi:hypothetical protein